MDKQSKKEKSSNEFLINLIANSVAIFTIFVAIYVTSPGTITENEEHAWILKLLLLLVGTNVTTNIVDKLRYSNKIIEIHKLLDTNLKQKVLADKFFQKGLPNLIDKFQSATTIDMCGVTLQRSVRNYLNIFEEKLNNGCTIRIMILNPDNNIAVQHAESKSRIKDAALYREQLRTTIQELKSLNDAKISGELQVRLMPFDPSFGMTITNRDNRYGFIACEIYQHISVKPSPAFFIYANNDKYWFDFYKEQYELIWKKSKKLI